MEESAERRTVNRRRLLRRAGVVAAGVAGAGVVGGVATPAFADDGDPLVIGQSNTGTDETGLTAGGVSSAALRLSNGASGPGLSLDPLVTDPTTFEIEQPSLQPATGGVYADDWGDLTVIGQPAGGALGGKYANLLYSPTWATMVVPISPIRYVDTRHASLRVNIVPGSTNFDGIGRVLPKNSMSVPDMIIDLSDLFLGGFGAVQANLTALLPVAQGYGSLWDSGPWPVTSSINYAPLLPEIANFTQTVIGPDRTIRLKTSVACQYILDIVGFVVTDPFSQFPSGPGSPGATAAEGGGQQIGGWRKRPPITG